MVTRAWKVYGTEGHRQRESFFPSYQYDFSNEQNGTRIIEVDNFDKTGHMTILLSALPGTQQSFVPRS